MASVIAAGTWEPFQYRGRLGRQVDRAAAKVVDGDLSLSCTTQSHPRSAWRSDRQVCLAIAAVLATTSDCSVNVRWKVSGSMIRKVREGYAGGALFAGLQKTLLWPLKLTPLQAQETRVNLLQRLQNAFERRSAWIPNGSCHQLHEHARSFLQLYMLAHFRSRD